MGGRIGASLLALQNKTQKHDSDGNIATAISLLQNMTVAAGKTIDLKDVGALGNAEIATDGYTGDDADNRAIAHGLGVKPKIVFTALTNGADNKFSIIDSIFTRLASDAAETVTAKDATNFYVDAANNANTATYQWVAIG